MQVLPSRFDRPFILILITALLIGMTGCDSPERDNPLDPKNPASFRPRVVLIELFVNLNPAITEEFNQNMIEAVETVSGGNDDRILVIQHHRNVSSYPDEDHLNESDDLYANYISVFSQEIKGVPDVFMNGVRARVQGYSDMPTAIVRLEQALDPLMVENSHFTIEAGAALQDKTLRVSVRLARLGDQSAENTLIRACAVVDYGEEYRRRVVTDIRHSNIIPVLEPGAVYDTVLELQYPDPALSGWVLVSAVSSDRREVYQSAVADW